MRAGRFTSLLVGALLVVGGTMRPFIASAAPSPVGTALSADRRISVRSSTGAGGGFGFGAKLHQAPLACSYTPAELNLNDLTLERTSHGYAATLIFFSPIRPLSELGGVPVTHVVRLTFSPPKGDDIVIRVSLNSGKISVKQGKEQLDLGDDAPSAVLNVDRIYVSLSDKLGIEPNWDVWANVQFTAKTPMCPEFGAPTFQIENDTPPATVGSLSGEDPAGTITLPSVSQDLLGPVPGGKAPNGAHMRTLTFEHDQDGSLVAVASMNSDVMALSQTDPASDGALTVTLDLASPGLFGMSYPYVVEWVDAPNFDGSPIRPARVNDPYAYGARFLGEVPVTVNGNQIRFHFGGFALNPNLKPEPVFDSLPIPIGDFASLFFGMEDGSDPICICPKGSEPNVGVDPATQAPGLEYEIIGNLIAITRLASGETAYGWIDHYGWFIAKNERELYRGLIKFFPDGDTYEVGVQLKHALILETDGESTGLKGSDAAGIALSPVVPGVRLMKFPATQDVGPGGNLLILIKIFLTDVTETDIYDCAHLREIPAADRGDLDSTRCKNILLAIAAGRQLLESVRDNPDLLKDTQEALGNTVGMSDPPPPVLVDMGIIFSTPATPTAVPAEPFPLPFAIQTDFMPVPANGDWAIRAHTLWATSETSASFTSPFVDGHLLLGGASLGSSGTPSSPMSTDNAAALAATPVRRLRVRRVQNGRTPSPSKAAAIRLGLSAF